MRVYVCVCVAGGVSSVVPRCCSIALTIGRLSPCGPLAFPLPAGTWTFVAKDAEKDGNPESAMTLYMEVVDIRETEDQVRRMKVSGLRLGAGRWALCTLGAVHAVVRVLRHGLTE